MQRLYLERLEWARANDPRVEVRLPTPQEYYRLYIGSERAERSLEASNAD